MRVVLANGCFDPLHYGHILHLRAARAFGDRLIVALTSDVAIRREKGPERPFYPWEERAEMLRELRCVSEVVHSDSGLDALIKVRPDIFVKGIDYAHKGVSEALQKLCETMKVPVMYTSTPKLSASAIVRRLRAVPA